jgi:putative transcriptional regulator
MEQTAIRAKLAAAYADGALDPALRLLVEAQSAAAPAGARILTGNDEEDQRPEAPAAPCGDLIAELSALPAVIQNAAIQALARRSWGGPLPGLKWIELDIGGKAVTRLLRVSPRARLPRHGHEGAEYALVLGGALADGVGRYQVGEVSFADDAVTHTPRAGDGRVLWMLVVRYGAMKLSGPVGLIQRLVLPNVR